MKYALTIYGPLVNNNAVRERVQNYLYDICKPTVPQARAVWDVLTEKSDFYSVTIVKLNQNIEVDFDNRYAPTVVLSSGEISK